MDRLLSDQEQAGLIWELSAAIEGSEGRQPTQQEIHEYLLKAQDDLTAHLVAQEIIGELEERCPHTPDDAFAWIKRMCPGCFQTIKSKYMEEKDERTD